MIKWIKHIKDTYNTYNERVRLSKELFKYIKSIDGIFIYIPFKPSRISNRINFHLNNPYTTTKAYTKIQEFNNYNINTEITYIPKLPGIQLSIKYIPYSNDIDKFLISQKIQGNY